MLMFLCMFLCYLLQLKSSKRVLCFCWQANANVYNIYGLVHMLPRYHRDDAAQMRGLLR